MPGWAMTLVNPVSMTLDSHMGSLLGQVVEPAASRAEMLSTAWNVMELVDLAATPCWHEMAGLERVLLLGDCQHDRLTTGPNPFPKHCH